MLKNINFKTDIIQNFAPGWFASVMGTAVTVVAIFVFKDFIPFAGTLQLFFLGLAVLLFVIFFIPWFLRWFLYFERVKDDLSHPVSGSFYSTMPISLIIIGIALEKAPHFLPEEMLLPILQFLWISGAAGIACFALTILNIKFMKPGVDLKIANMGWLIPPVSVLIVPILGSSLAAAYAGTTLGTINLIASLIFLGMGSLLFIFVMSAVFSRYISHDLLPAHLAPTIWIGIAPTAILSIIAIKLVQPLMMFFKASDTAKEVFGIAAKAMSVSLWGFAFLWAILAMTITIQHHQKINIPFAMSWWAFAFPLGAFVVSTGVVHNAVGGSFFVWVGLSAFVGLLLIWSTVFVKTVRGVLTGDLLKQ